jgi:hypothetical protein
VHTYTHDNLLASVTQPLAGDGLTRRRTTYAYDPGGRKVGQRVELVNNLGVALPLGDGGTVAFSYHPNDRLATQTGRGAAATITTAKSSWHGGARSS